MALMTFKKEMLLFYKPKKNYNDLEIISIYGYKIGDKFFDKEIKEITHISSLIDLHRVLLTFKDDPFIELLASRSECIFKNK